VNNCPLFVDLDGTLLSTDTLSERLLLFVGSNPLNLFKAIRWFVKGRVTLKQELAQRTELDIETLPSNPELLAFLKQEKAAGRYIALATATDADTARKIADRYQLFDAVLATESGCNLKGSRKLARIKELAPEGFAYAGNGYADLPIWRAADEIIAVSPGAGLMGSLKKMGARFYDLQTGRVQSWIKEFRLFHWLKNLLMLVPLVLAHKLGSPELVGRALFGMISFSLLASAIYVINDLLDLSADRHHPRKKFRPFACGKLQPHEGVLVLPALLMASLLPLLALPPSFAVLWLAYFVLNLAYSLKLKRMFLLDVLVLSQMYPLRIFAGTAATGVISSGWLIAFAGTLFMSLAVIKRYAELKEVIAADGERIKGRGYRRENLNMLMWIGLGFAALTLGVFIGYLHSTQVVALYSHPARLWGIAALVLYWLARVWMLAIRGRMKDDPVEFALTDWQTYLIGAISAALLIISI
jgi:4-hydroxybenzoate polyprenyltransferase/phosphoserine phosphatase